MKKLYIKTRNGKVYTITENYGEIRMSENNISRPAIKFATSVVLTKMPKPEKGKNCTFRFKGGKISTDYVSAYYYV